MNIQDALKETGKAIRDRKSWYVMKHNDIAYSVMNVDGARESMSMDIGHFFKDDWQPYHEVKEIRPENVGELWEKDNGHSRHKWVSFRGGHPEVLRFKHIMTGGEVILKYWHLKEEIIHGKNGWMRLFPSVKNENVERIEIEGVVWQDNDSSEAITPRGAGLKDIIKKHDLQNKPPMKMILEMAKEQ